MKRFLYTLLIPAIIVSCKNDDKKANLKHDSLVKKVMADTSNFTSIQWLDTSLSFGTIKQGEKTTELPMLLFYRGLSQLSARLTSGIAKFSALDCCEPLSVKISERFYEFL
jgi:hypothetical protein